MNSVDIEILRLVRRIRDRLHVVSMINHIMIGVAVALCFGIIMAIAARFIPIYNVFFHVLRALGAAVSVAFLYSAFKTPENTYAALMADSFGLRERTVTALELVGDRSPFALLEKKDALEHLRKIDYRKKIPLRPNRRYLMICMVLSGVLVLSAFIPNPTAEEAEELHRTRAKIAEQQKKADKLVERVRNNPRLSEEQKKELVQKLSELKKELDTAKDEKDIGKALGRAEKKLEYIRAEYTSGEDLDRIAEALSKNEMTKALADMIRNGDEKALKESIAKLSEELNKLSPEERQKLAENLSKLAGEIKSNPELSRAFAQLAEKLASGELGDISGELDRLNQSISELMEDEKIRNAISEITKELENALSEINDGQNRPGQDEGGSQGRNGAPGGIGGQGQDNQPAENSKGKGQGGGAGQGTGTGNENQEPVPSGSPGISRKGGSEGKKGEYEKIFTPQTLGGEGETSNLSGKKGAGGNVQQVETDRGMTVRGSSVPYNQVVGKYRERAVESMNSQDIPPGMKDLIREYFTSLEE